MGLGGFGETLPRYDNYCELDESETDAFGIPILRFHVTRDANDLAMRQDMMITAAEMLEAAGASEVRMYDDAEDAPRTRKSRNGCRQNGT